MDHQVMDLIVSRLERIEKQNDAQLELLHEHLQDDSKTKQIVNRHTVYFKGLGMGLTPLIAYIAAKLGLK